MSMSKRIANLEAGQTESGFVFVADGQAARNLLIAGELSRRYTLKNANNGPPPPDRPARRFRPGIDTMIFISRE